MHFRLCVRTLARLYIYIGAGNNAADTRKVRIRLINSLFSWIYSSTRWRDDDVPPVRASPLVTKRVRLTMTNSDWPFSWRSRPIRVWFTPVDQATRGRGIPATVAGIRVSEKDDPAPSTSSPLSGRRRRQSTGTVPAWLMMHRSVSYAPKTRFIFLRYSRGVRVRPTTFGLLFAGHFPFGLPARRYSV